MVLGFMIKTEMGVLQMTTGEKLQKLRKSNNITQEQLSEILNVSRQSISKWEGDLAFPETDKLIALAKIYHCSVDYLLNIEDNQSNLPNISAASEKSLFNTKKLPFLIASSFVAVMTFVLFALNWATAYDATISENVVLSFYKIIFTTFGIKNMLAPIGLIIFLFNFVILGLCISYYFTDKLLISILIRFSYIIKVFLLFIFKDWATILSPFRILTACDVQIGMDVTLIVISFILLAATKEFKSASISSTMKKNIFAFSTVGVSIFFFATSAVPFIYQSSEGYIDVGYIRYNKGFFYTLFTATFKFFEGGLLAFVLILFLVFVALLGLGIAYYFKPTKILKILIFILSCIETICFLPFSVCYSPTNGLKSTNTFLIITAFVLVALVITQTFILLFDRKKLKEKE